MPAGKAENRHPTAHQTDGVMEEMNTIIREIRPEEYTLLREFLYQAIYLPKGVEPPPRSVVDRPRRKKAGRRPPRLMNF